ncbi:hypothetical protein SAMN04515620_16019 [Collimonas sp. OK607]|uniref:NUDIX domain-containing protein n=1 Tax=Collimonas sp. OK607 TaxID=1798194 RepID=UPI0008E02ECE|nr:NUDIX domain-containing protein [Collimonas sp. OK607]SFB38807.1 hypothetical protein SAMN04515620_16019 [Collimonas sp. OK607]
MHNQAICEAHPASQGEREVVAAILTHLGRVGLFRRSARVTGDVGYWHCITGFLPVAADPLKHAILEIWEETNIAESRLELSKRTILDLKSEDGKLWRVHAFHFQSQVDAVHLNWENDACCWVQVEQIGALATVSWFEKVLEALLVI